MNYLFRAVAVFCMVALCVHLSHAQELSPLITDRPDQTESSAVVPNGYFQIESGISSETITDGTTELVTPTTLIRFGASDIFEFRAIFSHVTQRTNGIEQSGLPSPVFGFKTRLREEQGLLPSMAFIGHLSFPGLSSSGLRTTFAAPSFRFAMAHTLSDNISLGYNIGADWDGETGEPAFAYTAAAGVAMTESFGMYIEAYGDAPQKGTAKHSCDAGITYLISADLMVDFSGGIGLSRLASDHYIAGGISYRFLPYEL